MTIADVKTGGWALGERLLSEQANSVRAELLKCVDGVGGGTYTPSSTISIDDLTVGGTDRLKYGSRAVANMLPMSPLDDGDFAFGGHAGDMLYTQTAFGGNRAYFGISLPASGTLDTVTVRLRGAAGHGALPGTMPIVTVYRRSYNSETVGDVYTTTDTSASVPAYEAQHAVIVSVGYALTGASHWFVSVLGEAAPNNVAGLALVSAYASITFTEQPEW